MFLRRASVHLFSGMAGSFKTMVVLNLVAKMGVSTLAFSNDSDDLTVASRLLGIATGKDTEELESWIAQHPEEAGQSLSRYDFLRWVFAPNPSPDDLWLELYAYHEVEGRWPELLVVDILSNIGADFGDEWATLREVMRQANVIARETRAAVLLVHHCTDGSRNKVPTRGEVLGKISALPVLMVNFGVDEQGDLWAACVKNRFGKSDKDAKHPFRMQVEPACARVSDYVHIPSSLSYGGWGQGEDQGW
ncbi:AAA family ATPase [Streptomyces halobius]|uniref:Helicase RepA family protein n=1 Tax=Streptomyces halobius TaxID=2879846 RepID=A0ABY4M5W0_9ACTN|nr:helicase RepA family protein [Streptomyces halobius]